MVATQVWFCCDFPLTNFKCHIARLGYGKRLFFKGIRTPDLRGTGRFPKPLKRGDNHRHHSGTPPIPGLCILRDSSKRTNHDGYYCHSRVSVDSLNFESYGRSSYLSTFSSSVVRISQQCDSKDILGRWHSNVDYCQFIDYCYYYCIP